MTQQAIAENVAALVNRSRSVDGVPTSLWDLGYRTAGIDGGYNACVNGTMHDAGGNPLIDTSLFPDMKGLVDGAHALGVKMGWCAFLLHARARARCLRPHSLTRSLLPLPARPPACVRACEQTRTTAAAPRRWSCAATTRETSARSSSWASTAPSTTAAA
jgi:hypothetical protein